jgi:hypothetical protein
MKKVSFILIGFLIFAFTQVGWAGGPKFPKQIAFDLIKGGKEMGTCVYHYTQNVRKKAFNRKLYLLKLEDFKALGFTSQIQLHTAIFRDDLSVYLDSIIEGKEILSQIELQEKKRIDGKKGQVFNYEEAKGRGGIQTELFTSYKVVSFISSFFVASQRIATGKLGKQNTTESFNLVFDKSTKIIEIRYKGRKNVQFGGNQYDASEIWLTNPNDKDKQISRMLIIKDAQGYCFPVSIFYKDPKKGSFELRAETITK